MLGSKLKQRKISSTTTDKDAPKETKLTIDRFQTKNKRTDWNDVNDVLFTTSGFKEILNNNEIKEKSCWRAKAIAIDRFSLRFFPILFIIIMGVYYSIYMSGWVIDVYMFENLYDGNYLLTYNSDSASLEYCIKI